MSAIDDYRAALARLVSNVPTRLPKHSSINKDTVSLEAGRKRGSIKKSRPEHLALIHDIEAAARASNFVTRELSTTRNSSLEKRRIALTKKIEDLKRDYELALTKIVSLEYENFHLKVKLDRLSSQRESS